MPMPIRPSHHLHWLAIALLMAACAAPDKASRKADVEPEPVEQQPPGTAQSSQPEKEPASTPAPAEIRLTADPAGSSLRIGDHQPEHGQSIELAPGMYDLIVKSDGYLTHREQITLESAQNVVRHIELHPENAELTISPTPTDAAVEINGRMADVERPVRLSPGQYEITATHSEYFPWKDTLELGPGEERALDLNMEVRPTSGPITIEAHHPDAEIILDNEEIGAGREALEDLAFGKHRVESVRQLAEWRRERAEQNIRFEREASDVLRLRNPVVEYLYQGRWMEAEEALQEEASAYQSARTAEPVYLHASLEESVAEELAGFDDLGSWLHSLMRPGDRLVLDTGQAEVLLWARANQPDLAFEEAATAFQNINDHQPPWRERHGPEPREVTISEPADLSFALLAARPHSPMLALELAALEALEGKAPIVQAVSDGHVRLLIEGGSGLRLNGEEMDAGAFQLIDHPLSPDGASFLLEWDEAPERLLVMPETGNHISAPSDIQLLRGEKKLVTIPLDMVPERARQLTQRLSEPAFSRWHTLDSQLGPGRVLDLREVELGPHAQKGQYRRTWILELERNSGVTQRQVSVDYFIGERAIETESGLFLRRDENRIPGNEG